MRKLWPGLILLAGCAAATVAPVPDRGTAAAACSAAVAGHVGRPVQEVAAVWSGETPEGGGIVTVTDGGAAGRERVHLCELDAAGQVRAIRHTVGQ